MVMMVDDNKFKNKLRFRKRPTRASSQSVVEETHDNNKVVVDDDVKNNSIVDATVENDVKSENFIEKAPQKPPINYRFDNIVKSQQDAKNYRGLILKENGMRCMLVSDPAVEKSAVCLSVEVGHMQDPPDIPG
jgi:DUF438 domain-containing protein